MTAEITGFVTRNDAGLVDPRSVSRNVSPETGGVAIHYGGPKQTAAEPDSDHATCIRTWKEWQDYHRSKNWVDIAYNGGFCNHGYAFAGRGLGVRSAAQGTASGNQNYLAFVWIGGAGQSPTHLALNAADWWIGAARESGAASLVHPHSYFKTTACPGSFLINYAGSRNGRELDDVIPQPAPAPTPKPTPAPGPSPSFPYSDEVKAFQRLLGVGEDGKWGGKTDARAKLMQAAARTKSGHPRTLSFPFDIRTAQQVIGTSADGKWGTNSQKAMVKWVKEVQKELGVKIDGAWGRYTNNAFDRVRTQLRYNYRKSLPTTKPLVSRTKKFQKLLGVKEDGRWGPNTNERALQLRAAARTKAGVPSDQRYVFDTKLVQGVIGTKPDGKWGKNSQEALVGWVKEFQKLLGVKVDGKWGSNTDTAFRQAQSKNNGNY